MISSPFVYDLLSELRKDSARRATVTAAMQRVDKVVRDAAKGKASRQDVAEAQASLVPDSGFNFGLLIPSYFPRYPFDQPLSFVDRPFMFAMTCLAPNSVVTLKAGRQVGKCADGSTVVSTNQGRMTLDDIFDAGIKV